MAEEAREPRRSEPKDHRDNPNGSIGVGDVVPGASGKETEAADPPPTADMDQPGMDPEGEHALD
jgi:hypothetical protein